MKNPVRDILYTARALSPQASNATQASPTLSHQPQNPDGKDTVGGNNNDKNEEKTSHLRICLKNSKTRFELQDFGLYPWHKNNCIQRKWKQIMIAKNQISHLWCTASYKTATSNKLSSLVLHKTTSSGQDSWIRMLVAPARSVAGHLVTSSMFLSWSHVQALPAKAQWINDSCT